MVNQVMVGGDKLLK